MNIYSMKMKWMKIEYSKHVWKIENERRRRTNRRHNPQGLCFYCDCWCVKKIQALVRLVPFRTRKGTSWKREVRKNEQDVPGNVPSTIWKSQRVAGFFVAFSLQYKLSTPKTCICHHNL